MRRAQLDPDLSLRIVGTRTLRYSEAADPDEDRPDHVRAASGLAFHGGRLIVAQDDASFLAVVAADGVTAIRLPRGTDGRRRFEVALGNKADKLDLEACLVIDDELWAFGSGTLPVREKICRVQHAIVRVIDATPFYRRLREALGGELNLEGVARVAGELWLFHRGNTGPDDLGPAVLRVPLAAMRAWLDATAQLPTVTSIDGYELGEISGHRLGFTDAVAARDRVYYLAAAEASPNANDDGRILGSQLGIITSQGVRCAALCGTDGAPLKAEGLALDPARVDHAWVAIDPDDPDQPSTLLELELVGPW